ncbi:MAG: hypothetical protein B5M52_04790 [Helicobacteraceae bacterium 4484_230]|nr:MAG: hypothetical protein B5M52_04790 [Helicobacteraceae bacterium 4484_230]
MGKTNLESFASVLSINPYRDVYYSCTSNRLTPESNPIYSKSQYSIAFLNTNDFITALIGISKNIPDEDIQFVIETKAYEELALDMAVEYKIDYIEAPDNADEKNRFFHVFIVDPAILDEKFINAVDRIKYIDQIVPVPLLMKGLYQSELINDNGIHSFIYFQDNDAFFTIYNNQEFIYTKTLKYSFKQMHERFCELLGEQIGKDVFMKLLSEEGLSTQNSEHQKYLIKLFGELFLHINDVLTYAKRAYELEKIDSIYIGSQVGTVLGLDEYCQTYLSLESSPFDFDYGFDTDGQYIDQIQQLMQLYALEEEDERYEINFTVFHRPPPFLQRHSGKLIATTAASLMLAFAYPVTFWTLSYAENIHKNLLDQEYTEIHHVKLAREAAINQKYKEKEAAEVALQAEIDNFNEKKATLIKIHDIKVNYPMKGKILAEITRDLNRFKVGVSEIFYTEDNTSKTMSLQLIAKNDKQITDLLEFMTKNRTKRFSFRLDNIFLNEETKYYLGEMKVVLK